MVFTRQEAVDDEPTETRAQASCFFPCRKPLKLSNSVSPVLCKGKKHLDFELFYVGGGRFVTGFSSPPNEMENSIRGAWTVMTPLKEPHLHRESSTGEA